MKKFLVLFLSFLVVALTKAQYVPLGSPTGNNIARVNATLGLYVPKVIDTTHAFTQGSIDALGAIIQVSTTGNIYYRDTISSGGHKWTPFQSGISIIPTWEQTMDVVNGDTLTNDHSIWTSGHQFVLGGGITPSSNGQYQLFLDTTSTSFYNQGSVNSNRNFYNEWDLVPNKIKFRYNYYIPGLLPEEISDHSIILDSTGISFLFGASDNTPSITIPFKVDSAGRVHIVTDSTNTPINFTYLDQNNIIHKSSLSTIINDTTGKGQYYWKLYQRDTTYRRKLINPIDSFTANNQTFSALTITPNFQNPNGYTGTQSIGLTVNGSIIGSSNATIPTITAGTKISTPYIQPIVNGGLISVSTITGGTGYTPGTYNLPLVTSAGGGSAIISSIVVGAGGNVTQFNFPNAAGSGFAVGDIIQWPAGTGTGFSVTVLDIQDGVSIRNLAGNKLWQFFNTGGLVGNGGFDTAGITFNNPTGLTKVNHLAITSSPTGTAVNGLYLDANGNVIIGAAGGGTVTGGTITWPGALYNTPTTGTVTSGTLNFSPALATQTANKVLSSPNGSSGTPSFRALVAADIPALATLTLGRGLTGTSYNTTVGITATLDSAQAYTWTNNNPQVFTGGFYTNVGAQTTSNFSVVGASGAINTGGSSNLFNGASQVSARAIFGAQATSFTIPANNNYTNVLIGGNKVSTGATGTNALIASLVVKGLTSFTSGGASVTNLANIYIDTTGLAAITVTGKKYGIWDATPNSRFNNVSADVLLTTPSLISTGSFNITPTVTSAATLAMSVTASNLVFTGTNSTWTLPTVSGNTGYFFFIKNKGSGTITLNSNSGGNDIYPTTPTNTFAINAGTSYTLVNDGTTWDIH
jgi:hypothetical protein